MLCCDFCIICAEIEKKKELIHTKLVSLFVRIFFFVPAEKHVWLQFFFHKKLLNEKKMWSCLFLRGMSNALAKFYRKSVFKRLSDFIGRKQRKNCKEAKKKMNIKSKLLVFHCAFRINVKIWFIRENFKNRINHDYSDKWHVIGVIKTLIIDKI